MQLATFGAGCFWGVEDTFMKTKGVTKTSVGFMGGTTKDPSYKEVCSKGTGHVEVCQVEFDESVISYQELLDIFWDLHDPTQGDRQGYDVGSQYRSVIFYHSEEQNKIAEKSKKTLQEKLHKTITTTIEPAQEYYLAEEYHQQYFKKNGGGACHI
ncbi:TPA: peptide-methionine (S)-S-oxide reductase MsrA [Candidatus Woesearchaeota archaeon]|nr:peptide-methionine (S)-S-oxide reductase MsrA [Candidatus Woesearchaeota archaeon]